MVATGTGQELVDVIMAGTETKEDDLPSIAAGADGTAWLVWLAYADRRDEIAVRHWSDGSWGNLRYVPGTSGDVWLPQAGVDGAGRLWVAWTQILDGNWDLNARCLDPEEEAWSPVVRLTDHPLPDINPRMAPDGRGGLAVVWAGLPRPPLQHRPAHLFERQRLVGSGAGHRTPR